MKIRTEWFVCEDISCYQTQLSYEVEETIFWTVWLITIQYIKKQTKRFDTFVASGTVEIRKDITGTIRNCPKKYYCLCILLCHCVNAQNLLKNIDSGMDLY